MKFPAPGLEGGDFGLAGNVTLNGVKVERFVPIAWKPGDTVVLRVPGGGGYGDPKLRERDKVREDVALGYVSAQAAREQYGLDITESPEAIRLDAIRRYVNQER